MKQNMKKTMLIALVFALALSLTGCDTGGGGKPEPVEQPKEQTATINPFENYKVTVKGTFTDSEWTGIAGTIEATIKSSYESMPDFIQVQAKARYAKCEAIFVEKTSDYDRWKTTGDGKTFYINYINVVDTKNLQNIINIALQSMENFEKTQDDICPCPDGTLHPVGKVCCSSRNNILFGNCECGVEE